jgi:hypothetical protein
MIIENVQVTLISETVQKEGKEYVKPPKYFVILAVQTAIHLSTFCDTAFEVYF